MCLYVYAVSAPHRRVCTARVRSRLPFLLYFVSHDKVDTATPLSRVVRGEKTLCVLFAYGRADPTLIAVTAPKACIFPTQSVADREEKKRGQRVTRDTRNTRHIGRIRRRSPSYTNHTVGYRMLTFEYYGISTVDAVYHRPPSSLSFAVGLQHRMFMATVMKQGLRMTVFPSQEAIGQCTPEGSEAHLEALPSPTTPVRPHPFRTRRRRRTPRYRR